MRSHAMRTALQLRGHSSSKSGELAVQTSAPHGDLLLRDGLTGRFRVAEKPAGRKGSRKARGGKTRLGHTPWIDPSGLVEWFGNNQVDPFGQLPVEINSRVEILVKYSKSRCYTTRERVGLADHW